MEATIAVQSELIVEKELQSLKKYAENKGFEIFNLNSLTFVAKNLCAKGGDRYSLIVECDDYPNLPPIFRWCNGETLEFEGIKDVPKGDGGYFHSSRTPCAPWNRNSYKQFQGNGPSIASHNRCPEWAYSTETKRRLEAGHWYRKHCKGHPKGLFHWVTFPEVLPEGWRKDESRNIHSAHELAGRSVE